MTLEAVLVRSKWVLLLVNISASMVLENSSIVFLADEVVPKMFTHHFLSFNGVVDSKAEPTASITSVLLTRLQYPDGTFFEATDQRIKLEVRYPDPLPFPEDDRLSDMLRSSAEQLLKPIAYLSFIAVGINFKVIIEAADVARLVTGLPANAKPDLVSYVADYEDFVVSIKMQRAKKKEDLSEAVVLDANFHADIPPGLSGGEQLQFLSDVLNRRGAYLTELRRLIDETQL